jgi:hypothetical protein
MKLIKRTVEKYKYQKWFGTHICSKFLNIQT